MPWPFYFEAFFPNRGVIPLEYVVGSSSGATYGMFDTQFRRFEYEPAFADFDHDGLRAAEEAIAGTSDQDDDSDDDGFNDFYERTTARTSPTDSTSTPATPGLPDFVLAPSYFPQHFMNGTRCRLISPTSFGDVQSGAPERRARRTGSTPGSGSIRRSPSAR